MCLKLPERRVELDRCEATIIDIFNVYGPKFYDYHYQFSAKAAAALRDYHIKVDWAIKDLALLNMVSSNARINSCNLCNSTMHSSAFCPKLNQINQQASLGNTRTINTREMDKHSTATSVLLSMTEKFATISKRENVSGQLVNMLIFVPLVILHNMGPTCARKGSLIHPNKTLPKVPFVND